MSLCLVSKLVQHYYRPQRSWGKVMFLHVSEILFKGGGVVVSQHALQQVSEGGVGVVSQHALWVSRPIAREEVEGSGLGEGGSRPTPGKGPPGPQ